MNVFDIDVYCTLEGAKFSEYVGRFKVSTNTPLHKFAAVKTVKFSNEKLKPYFSPIRFKFIQVYDLEGGKLLELKNVEPIDQKPQQTTSSWLAEVEQLEIFFNTVLLPKSLRLNTYSLCFDVVKFSQSAIKILKAQNGRLVFIPYLERLRLAKQIIERNETTQLSN